MAKNGTPREPSFEARVNAIRYAAQDINIYEFSTADGSMLVDVDPGAHIDVALPNGITRQYSLICPGPPGNSYSIAVKRDANSRGGSRFMHEQLRVGQRVIITGPRNNFPLFQNAAHTVLIAGGIGITPIWCMIRRLMQVSRKECSWTLYYSCRTRSEAAFLSDLEMLPDVQLNFDTESGQTLDIASIVEKAPRAAHLYCCGPAPMLTAFEASTEKWPPEQKHVEYFMAKDAPILSGTFVVELRRSRREFAIPAGKSILQVLRDAGIDVSYSCEQGVCGSCETRVIAGIPDHHDSILTAAEQAANDTAMICCAGSKTERLVLDL
jgi:tetrachlorobenzoquinone reductase